jgi:tetratricopeptide (TPR) repeat protein
MKKNNIFCKILVLSVVLTLMAVMPFQVFAQTKNGIELYNSWKFPEAEKVLREALKVAPGDMQAAYYLGLSLLLQDKHEEALEVLKKVKGTKDTAGKLDKSAVPDEFQIQVALARTYLELKKLPEALKNLEAAAQIHPEAADVYTFRGAYYLQQANLKKAAKDLEKALDLDAQNAYANYYLGHVYLRQGDPSKAVEMFKTFLQLAPQAPEAPKAKALVDALC